jgi:hypothetical protein
MPGALNDLVLTEKTRNDLAIPGVSPPHGDAPALDHFVPFGPGRRCQNVGDGQFAALLRQLENRPGLLRLSKFHVRQLDLPAGKLPLDVQVQANKSKSQPDRFVIFACSLGGERIDNVLMDETGIAVGDRVIRQLVVDILLVTHRDTNQ